MKFGSNRRGSEPKTRVVGGNDPRRIQDREEFGHHLGTYDSLREGLIALFNETCFDDDDEVSLPSSVRLFNIEGVCVFTQDLESNGFGALSRRRRGQTLFTLRYSTTRPQRILRIQVVQGGDDEAFFESDIELKHPLHCSADNGINVRVSVTRAGGSVVVLEGQ